MIKCRQNHEVKVLKSNAGYYIGTMDIEDRSPYCRISVCYWDSKEQAQKLLDGLNFEQREFSEEITFCNGHGLNGCNLMNR